jgi:hypothetical protein
MDRPGDCPDGLLLEESERLERHALLLEDQIQRSGSGIVVEEGRLRRLRFVSVKGNFHWSLGCGWGDLAWTDEWSTCDE